MKIIDELWSKEDDEIYSHEMKSRRFEDVEKFKEDLKVAALSRQQHAKKVQVITDFIKDNYQTTNYLYNEVQRIKRTRVVKDDLRKMIEYLEEKDEKKLKRNILECYRKARLAEEKATDLWKPDTNNLLINVLRDPYNDGFLN